MHIYSSLSQPNPFCMLTPTNHVYMLLAKPSFFLINRANVGPPPPFKCTVARLV